MAAAKASYAITLVTDGGDGVKAVLNGVAITAQQASAIIAKAYDANATSAEKAAQREAAAAVRAEEAERKRMAAAAQRISDSLDPTAPLQRSFDRETNTASSAMNRGLISQQQYDAYLQKLKTDLVDSTNALREHGGVLGLNRAQYITAQSAVLRFTDSIIAGRNPITALSLEAHKVVEVMSLGDEGMAGSLSTVGGLINPVTIGFAVLTAGMVAGAAAAASYAVQLNELSRVADGYGRTSQVTGQQLLDNARAGAAAGEITVGSAKNVEEAILHETRSSGEALEQAASISQRFASAMGVDAKAGAELLAKALAEPAKAADDLAAKYGLLTPAQVEQVHQLMEQNRLTEAQVALLHDLDGSLDKTGTNVFLLSRAWAAVESAASQAAAAMGAALSASKYGAGGTAAGPQEAAKRTNDFAQQNFAIEQARQVTAKYGLSRDNNPEREQLGTDLAKEKTALAALTAQHKETSQSYKDTAASIASLSHAYETYLPQMQKEVAIAHDQAMMKTARFDKNGADYKKWAAQLSQDQHAGEVGTQDQFDAIANSRAEGANVHPARQRGAGAAQTAARNAAAMAVEAAASLALADAYLKSGDAALKAEAYRKGATEATRKGADDEAQATRQLNLMVAEQIANSAKGVRAMEDETAARNRVLEAVHAGLLPASEMEQALQREAALRSLVALQTVAQGDQAQHLTAVIKAQSKAIDDNIASLKALAAQQAIDAANDNARADRLRGQLAGDHDPVDRARQQSLADSANKGFTSDDANRVAGAAAGAASAKQAADSATWLANERQRIALAGQLDAAQASGDDDAFKRRTLLNQLDQAGIVLTNQQITDVLAAQAAEKSWSTQIQQHAQAIQQLKDEGASALNQLLSPDGIENWGQTWHNVIRKIATDLEQLALLNPLENMIFGGSRPSLGSGSGGLGGLFSSLFGGGASGANMAVSSFNADDWLPSISSAAPELSFDMPAFAGGTDSAPGGLSLVGENGPEIVNLPRGASVMTASNTAAALQGKGGDTHLHMPVSIDARGAGPREIDQLRVELRSFQAQVPSMAVAAVSNAQSRRLTNLAA